MTVEIGTRWRPGEAPVNPKTAHTCSPTKRLVGTLYLTIVVARLVDIWSSARTQPAARNDATPVAQLAGVCRGSVGVLHQPDGISGWIRDERHRPNSGDLRRRHDDAAPRRLGAIEAGFEVVDRDRRFSADGSDAVHERTSLLNGYSHPVGQRGSVETRWTPGLEDPTEGCLVERTGRFDVVGVERDVVDLVHSVMIRIPPGVMSGHDDAGCGHL